MLRLTWCAPLITELQTAELSNVWETLSMSNWHALTFCCTRSHTLLHINFVMYVQTHFLLLLWNLVSHGSCLSQNAHHALKSSGSSYFVWWNLLKHIQVERFNFIQRFHKGCHGGHPRIGKTQSYCCHSVMQQRLHEWTKDACISLQGWQACWGTKQARQIPWLGMWVGVGIWQPQNLALWMRPCQSMTSVTV